MFHENSHLRSFVGTLYPKFWTTPLESCSLCITIPEVLQIFKVGWRLHGEVRQSWLVGNLQRLADTHFASFPQFIQSIPILLKTAFFDECQTIVSMIGWTKNNKNISGVQTFPDLHQKLWTCTFIFRSSTSRWIKTAASGHIPRPNAQRNSAMMRHAQRLVGITELQNHLVTFFRQCSGCWILKEGSANGSTMTLGKDKRK